MSGKKIVMLIAQQDFRDEEYFIPKAMFEQQGIEITTAAPEKGQAIGTFGGVAAADTAFENISIQGFDGFVFVGGAGAVTDLNNNDIKRIAKNAACGNKIIAAICIAPSILAETGILKGKKAAVWSSNMDKSAIKTLEKGGALYQKEPVVVDGNIITANGPAQARKFAETVIQRLTLHPKALGEGLTKF